MLVCLCACVSYFVQEKLENFFPSSFSHSSGWSEFLHPFSCFSFSPIKQSLLEKVVLCYKPVSLSVVPGTSFSCSRAAVILWSNHLIVTYLLQPNRIRPIVQSTSSHNSATAAAAAPQNRTESLWLFVCLCACLLLRLVC